MRRSRLLICSIIVLVVGCFCVVSSAASSGDEGGAPASVVEAWPNWTGEVSCGSPFDPLVAFARPADAEYGSLPSEVALRRYLAKTRSYFTHSPAHPWRLLVETGTRADFGRGDFVNGGIEVNQFERGPKGWRWVGLSGSCQPALLRHHQEAVVWTLARGQQLTPSTVAVTVDVHADQCASVAVVKKRLERPEFREESGALLMALWVRPPPPLPPHTFEACGETEDLIKIPLPEPLGERELLDGGVFPPLSSVEQIKREERI
jgi:hypothetical protein